MTQNPGAYARDSRGAAAQPSTTDVAREEAANVGQSVLDAGGRVAQTATGQAQQVVSEVGHQARDLLGEARGQARQQASAQQHRAAQQLGAVADELGQMADKGGQSGLATEVAQQAAQRVRAVASWLDQCEPGDLLDGIRDFARRRPGTFLLGAAVAGLAAGRLTRGMTAAAGSDGQAGPQPGAGRDVPPVTAVPAAEPQPVPGYGAGGVSGPAVGGTSEQSTAGYPGSGSTPAGPTQP